MDVMKFSQRMDVALGVASLVAAAIFAYHHSYGWMATFLVSAVISFLSAKYTPAKWLLKRLLLSRAK
jgi:hypothetical protein